MSNPKAMSLDDLVNSASKKLLALINKEKAMAELAGLKNLSSPRYLRNVAVTITDSEGGVYQDDSKLYISKYEVQERIAELEAQLTKEEEDDDG